MKAQTTLLPAVIGIIIVIGLAVVVIIDQAIEPVEARQLKKFSSYAEMENYIKTSFQSGDMPYIGGLTRTVSDTMITGVPTSMPLAEGAADSQNLGSEKSGDYSTTNIQVEGVDEADMVKTDGKYIYIVSDNKVFIVDAYPADDASIISEIDPEGTVQEIFVNGDKLILFGQKNNDYDYPMPLMDDAVAAQAVPEKMMPRYYYSPEMYTQVYDISDRENPDLVRDLVMNGSYYDSRMIGDYVYIVINSPIERDHIVVPLIYENGAAVRTAFPEVYYFDSPDYSYRFTTIMSINTQDDSQNPNSEIYMMSSATNMYVSQDNIYITYRKSYNPYIYFDKIVDQVFLPVTPADVDNKIAEVRNMQISDSQKMGELAEVFSDYFNRLNDAEKQNIMSEIKKNMETVQKEIAKELEKTIIQKIGISNGEIEYKAQGSVYGYLLNQFSMDESGDYFRAATTTGGNWWGSGQTEQVNNIYVLDSNLNTVGKLEDLAPGERIYSVRFIGDRGYMVTFKKIDPLFVIDLSQPTNPTVLGKLKIPGYSDYLHPYDENHIIGIGKDTVEGESETRDFAWYQGIKIALFDVSDVENPIEEHKIIIGDRGTDSYALQDHRAFLFSKEKNLLVIPILLAEIEDKNKVEDWSYGDYVYQGAYVYDLTAEDGFDLRGRITHYDSDEPFMKSGYYFRGDYSIQRSLYIGDTLYTISSNKLQANFLDSLDEIKEIIFQPEVY
ncbi:MAG: beta-propeller domain-containing protein [Candidatus Aenigmatarchaeota archaeon]